MGVAIKQCVSETLIAKCAHPFVERQMDVTTVEPLS